MAIAIVPEGGLTVRAEEAGLLVGEASGAMPSGALGDVVPVTITRQNGTAEGTVFGADGMTAVPLALVELRSEDGVTLIDSTTADSAGTYRFAGKLPPGTPLTVRALFPDDTTLQAEAQVTASGALEVVRADMTLSGVTVIKGFAFDSDGVTPLASTELFLTLFGTTVRTSCRRRRTGRGAVCQPRVHCSIGGWKKDRTQQLTQLWLFFEPRLSSRATVSG